MTRKNPKNEPSRSVIFPAHVRYWRADLLRIAASLTKRANQRVWSPASLARLERDVLIGFYAIRKLVESHCLNNFGTMPVRVKSFRSRGRRLSFVIFPVVENYFDLSNAIPESLSVGAVCNLLIHSIVFTPHFDANKRLAGLFFTSDRYEKVVYLVSLPELIRLLETAAKTRSRGIRIVPDQNRQMY